MEPADELTSDTVSFCLAKPGEVYVIFLPEGLKNTELDLGGAEGNFAVQWFDPRNGGELLQGSVETIDGDGVRSVGQPPEEPEKDWVVLIIRN